MIDIAPVSEENQGALGMSAWAQGRLTESSMSLKWRLNEESVWDCRMWSDKEFHILGSEIRKAREPNERLCRGTESERLADERVDLVDLW